MLYKNKSAAKKVIYELEQGFGLLTKRYFETNTSVGCHSKPTHWKENNNRLITWSVIEQMMLIGLGTRKCQMPPLLQEGSCAWNGTPESRFPVRLRTCSPLLVPVCAASWGVRVPHLWQRSIGTSLCTATVPGLWRLKLEVPKPLGAPQHSAWV